MTLKGNNMKSKKYPFLDGKSKKWLKEYQAKIYDRVFDLVDLHNEIEMRLTKSNHRFLLLMKRK